MNFPPLIPILYQDNQVVVVNKPAGMLVHRSYLDKHETVFLMQTLRNQIGWHVYPVHCLDRPTSGVMLFALNADAARNLSQQFEQHTVQKTYWAIVRGWTQDSGCIHYPLKEVLDDIADKWAQQDKVAQSALTDYRTLARAEMPFASQLKFPTSRYSWLQLTPKTGRKHQIRRHLKHIFHPIVGDTTYGDLKQNQAMQRYCGNTRLLLHAYSLTFRQPETGTWLNITAPIDEAWAKVHQQMNWQVVQQ